MRQRKADLRCRVNGSLAVEFTASGLTSYAGLELLLRYLRATQLNALLRRWLQGTKLRGDFGTVAMVRVLLGLLIVGGRRLRHIAYVAGDPLFLRFCGLTRLPSARTLSRWLKNFNETWVERLRSINAWVVAPIVKRLPLKWLSVDVDGTVNSTGLQVERAFRGYNPHHRKVPSYYAITAYLAETGHVLRVKNRSGNVHDGKASLSFLRALFTQIRETLGACYRLRFRMDGAFFRQDVVALLERHKAGYAIRVPFFRWLDLQGRIRQRRRWQRVDREVEFFEDAMAVTPWNTYLRIAIYRKRVFHRSAKNYQLDLFDPDDGYYEYSAIATNLDLSAPRLWRFMCGRGAHEKAIGELKSSLAFASIPTQHYGANSAWQQLVALAHNLLVNFQIEGGAARRPRGFRATALFVLKSAQTLRFELFHRAGLLLRPNGSTLLRLAANPQVERAFTRLARNLPRVA
ncbi:MAG: IS1380 family transposase [bacterium]|nr:IS1380 family transposase [bacterium]